MNSAVTCSVIFFILGDNMKALIKRNKKNIIIGLLTVTLLIILPAVIIIATRDKNFNDCFNEGIPDNEYLDVFDLRIADLMQDKEQKEYLEKLTADMIEESYKTNGTSRRYADVISDDRFRRLDPKQKYNDRELRLGKIEPHCICTDTKAIVFMAREMKEEDSVYTYSLVSDGKYYNRLYFIKTDGEWVVEVLEQYAW